MAEAYVGNPTEFDLDGNVAFHPPRIPRLWINWNAKAGAPSALAICGDPGGYLPDGTVLAKHMSEVLPIMFCKEVSALG